MTRMIEGEGGKGGGGRAAQEADNTLRSSALVRVLELISEGECEGVVGGLKGVYFNDTPVQNTDNSFNFERVSYDERFGLPSQEYMTGFPSAEAEVTVGSNVTITTPVVKTVSTSAVDAVRVTIQLPQGLTLQDTKTGDLNGTSVLVAIDRKLTSSSTWQQVGADILIEGKTTKAYERQYYVARPSGAGQWDVRVRRISADPVNSAVRNHTVFARMTEIQDVKLEYPDCAYLGIAVDAESVGSQIPRRSYLVRGVKLQIPANYNPITRVYTGTWDGTFQTAWSNNPAWVLYDLLTNDRYGMGEFVSEDSIDKFSFYNAAKYNDELVPDGNGGTEPRFTFDTPIVVRGEAIKLLQNVAGAFRSTIVYSGGLLSLNQDRPSAPVKLVTNANVIGGTFTRRSSAKEDRHTSINMTWNDKNDRYLPKVTTIDDTTGIERYGFNVLETASYGATTEGQAIRNAKWILDTELNQTKMLSYATSLAQFDLKIGDVIKVFDQHYTTTAGSGRILSATSTSVTLDRPVTITSGATIDVTVPTATGTQFVTKTITNSAGTYTTLNVSVAFESIPVASADYIVTAAVSPEQYRIMRIAQEQQNIITVEAIAYDQNKYNRIELGINVPAPVFTAIDQTTIGNPLNLAVTPTSSVTSERVTRGLLLTWDAPTNGIPVSYNVKYRFNSGNYRMFTSVTARSFDVENADSGKYDFVVYSVGVGGVQSSGAAFTYTLDLTSGTGSPLLAVTGLQVVGGGTTFTGQDLNIQWTNPAGNAPESQTVTLKDFEVKFIDPTTLDVLRTVYVPPVEASEVAKTTYTFTMSMTDNGPRRALNVEVRCRDTNNKTSASTNAAFSNPAPAVVGNLTATASIFGVLVSFDFPTDPDFEGVIVWSSTTSGFTPSAANKVFQGRASVYNKTDAVSGTVYYFKVAAYDSFGSSDTGTGLNVSGQVSTTAISQTPGIPGGASLPVTGMVEGDSFFNTSDGALYFYHSGVWVRNAMKVGSATVMASTYGVSVGDFFSNTTDNKLYKWNGYGWVMAVVDGADIIANSITAAKINIGSLTADTAFINNVKTGILDAYQVNANMVTSSTSNTLTANVNQLNMVASSTASLLRTSGKTYGDGQWGFVLGAAAGNTSNYVEFFNGANHLKMHSNGEFYLKAGNGSSTGMVLTNNSLTINELNVVGSSNIAGGAVSAAYVNTGSSGCSVTFVVPTGCAGIVILAYPGQSENTAGGESSPGGTYNDYGHLTLQASSGSPVEIGLGTGVLMRAFDNTAIAGTYTAAISRYQYGTLNIQNSQISVMVLKK